MQVGFDILFESSIIKNLMGNVDQAEDLYESYQSIKTALDLMSAPDWFLQQCKQQSGWYPRSRKITNAEKLKSRNCFAGCFQYAL